MREYKGSGKTIYLNAKVTDYENKDYEFTVKLIFSKDCDKNSDVIKDAESTTKTTSTTTTTTKTTPTTTKTTTTTAKNTTTSTSKTTTTTKPVDNGTIKLSASKACLIKGKSITVTADINNALDSTVDWLGDSCLSISSQGNTATITGNNCGAHPIVTGRLHNGAKDTATLNYEDTLSYTVKNSNGATLTPNGDENYEGSNFIITTNVKANMVFNKNSGGQIDSASNTTQFNLDTKGWQGKVTITTSCGQTKTINIEPKVN